MCTSQNYRYGSNPIDIQWDVVRGDTSSLRIDFLENDESTHFDTTDWEYKATAYDSSGDVLDLLDIKVESNHIIVSISANTSKNWGNKYSKIVAELPFDIQVDIPGDCEDTIWTPVIGTIRVIGDVSPGGSL